MARSRRIAGEVSNFRASAGVARRNPEHLLPSLPEVSLFCFLVNFLLLLP